MVAVWFPVAVKLHGGYSLYQADTVTLYNRISILSTFSRNPTFCLWLIYMCVYLVCVVNLHGVFTIKIEEHLFSNSSLKTFVSIIYYGSSLGEVYQMVIYHK